MRFNFSMEISQETFLNPGSLVDINLKVVYLCRFKCEVDETIKPSRGSTKQVQTPHEAQQLVERKESTKLHIEHFQHLPQNDIMYLGFI